MSSDSETISRLGLGSSMPMTLRPGMVATRADSADMFRAMSSASAMTRRGGGDCPILDNFGPAKRGVAFARAAAEQAGDPGALVLGQAECEIADPEAGKREQQ